MFEHTVRFCCAPLFAVFVPQTTFRSGPCEPSVLDTMTILVTVAGSAFKSSLRAMSANVPCGSFEPQLWKQDSCKSCFCPKAEHPVSAAPAKSPTAASAASTVSFDFDGPPSHVCVCRPTVATWQPRLVQLQPLQGRPVLEQEQPTARLDHSHSLRRRRARPAHWLLSC